MRSNISKIVQISSLILVVSLKCALAIDKCIVDDDCIENEINYYCCDYQCCNIIDYVFKDK